MSEVARNNAEYSNATDLVVVDDDQLTLDIVAWILGKSQVTYTLFTDPEIAIKRLSDCAPRFLIVDYYMPSMNGIDFLSRLKTCVEMDDCAVYLCSAVVPEQEQLDEIKALGANILEKSTMCDRSGLLEILGVEQCVTGNK